MNGFYSFFLDKCLPKAIKSLLSVTPLRNRSFGFRFYEWLISINLLTLWDTFAGVFRNETIKNLGCFLFCQQLLKFRSDFKWKGSFWCLPTGIFGIVTYGGGSLISVELKIGKSHSYWLARFNRRMSFYFLRVFPLISDRSA